MMKLVVLSIVVLLLVIAQAKEICISVCDGNDVNGCGSSSNCCNSLQFVLNSIAVPNDIIIFGPGDYNSAKNLNIQTTLSNITITSSDGPKNTIIHLENYPGSYFISVSNSTNFILNNLTLNGKTTEETNYVEEGIVSFRYSENITISNCIFTNSSVFSWPAIFYYSNNGTLPLFVKNCLFENLTQTVTGGWYSTGYGVGLYFDSITTELFVEGCEFSYITLNAGYGVALGSTLIIKNALSGGIYDCFFHKNTIVDNTGAKMLSGTAISSIFIENQVMVENCIFIQNILVNAVEESQYGGIIINGDKLVFSNCYFENYDEFVNFSFDKWTNNYY